MVSGRLRLPCAKKSDASALAPLLDGRSTGELEIAAGLSAERHERSEHQLGYRTGYSPRLLTLQGFGLAVMGTTQHTGGQ